MKAIVAGGRKLSVTDSAIQCVMDALNELNVTEVVSGGAPGGDQIGEIAARRMEIPVNCFAAEWERFGRGAGPIRNEEMATYVGPKGACILLPGGSGTADMERRARERGLLIWKIELIHEKSETAQLYGWKKK